MRALREPTSGGALYDGDAPASGSSGGKPVSNGGAPANRLGVEIQSEVQALVASLAAAFASFATPVRRPSDLAKVLGIDVPLASRVFRLAHAADPAEAIDCLPTLNQLKRVVVKSAELAPGETADRAVRIVEHFESLAAELGEDQRDFESLVALHIPTGVRRVEIAQRRAAFRANTYLWGRMADCLTMLVVFTPGKKEACYDATAVLGYVGARMLRPGAEFHLGLSVPQEEVQRGVSPRVAASSTKAKGDLLTEFSNVPPESVQNLEPEDGVRLTRITLSGSRPADAATIYTRQFLPDSAGRDRPGSCNSLVLLSWPAARMHLDLAVPSGVTDPASLVLEAFANHQNPLQASTRLAGDRVPLHETARAVPGVTALPPVPGLPRFHEIFDSTVRWLGHEGSRFDVYRCDIEFPMMHSVIHMAVQFKG